MLKWWNLFVVPGTLCAICSINWMFLVQCAICCINWMFLVHFVPYVVSTECSWYTVSYVVSTECSWYTVCHMLYQLNVPGTLCTICCINWMFLVQFVPYVVSTECSWYIVCHMLYQLNAPGTLCAICCINWMFLVHCVPYVISTECSWYTVCHMLYQVNVSGTLCAICCINWMFLDLTVWHRLTYMRLAITVMLAVHYRTITVSNRSPDLCTSCQYTHSYRLHSCLLPDQTFDMKMNHDQVSSSYRHTPGYTSPHLQKLQHYT
jgi:hypothetical protein